MEKWEEVVDVRAIARLGVLEMESGFLCNGEEGKAVAQDAKSLAGILPSTIKRVGAVRTTVYPYCIELIVCAAGTEPFAGRASEDIVCQVSDGRKRGELKNLNEVVLRNLDERDDDKVATVDVVKSDCEETCIMVELKEVSGKVSFHEEMRSLVERPAICANYPRKED